MQSMDIVLLDGYVDEPSCLGVPPYISPYVRYLAGAIEDAGNNYTYLTIDEFRKRSVKIKNMDNAQLLVIVGGAVVPGKYLRGTPASVSEIEIIAEDFKGIKLLGGPLARFGFSGRSSSKRLESSFDFISKKDADAFLYDLLTHNGEEHRSRTDDEWRRWSILGSQVISHHPDFPDPLVIELESYRGCARYRTGGCAFCIEPLFGEPRFRKAEDIMDEVAEMSKIGAVNFRLGAQSCIFTYGSLEIGESETPKPDPKIIGSLLRGIRRSARNLRVLHTDNANPAVISEHPKESEEILRSLVKYCSSGNVLALGMESADPKVISANNLNAKPHQVKFAMELINKFGRARGDSGMPKLLPGLNILCGLSKETKETYDLNFDFLKEVLDSDLLLRRINIRQVSPVRRKFNVNTRHSDFIRFKKKVREKIDHAMLRKVVPPNTILRDVYLEKRDGKTTFGRQIGTYPVLVGIPYPISEGVFTDVIIFEYGQRSITGLEFPLNINKASLLALSSLPGIGKKRAARIVRGRPFSSREQLIPVMDDEKVARDLLDYISL